MSEFSKDVLTSCMPAIDPGKVQFLYSPADTSRFHPVSESEKMALRQKLLPSWMPRNAFILGWVGRNQWRKQVWLPYKVLAYLRHGNYWVCQDCHRVNLPNEVQLLNEQLGLAPAKPALPNTGSDLTCRHCRSGRVEKAMPLSDIYLWLHMNDEPNITWQKSGMEQLYGVKPGQDIHYTDGHEALPSRGPSDMAELYQLWDCLLYLSGGEGFGLPAWEALCSSLPVVYTNYSSPAEFLTKANAGLPVGGLLQPESASCIWRMIADVPQVLEAVLHWFADRQLVKRLGSNGRAFVQ
jgi:glycosyltransferase involved in cell wall biosynthesis